MRTQSLFTLPSDDVMSGLKENIQLVCVGCGVKFHICDVVSTV